MLGASLLAGSAPMIIGRATAADPLGIGFVYVGPVEDFGWTHAHDVGRKAIEAELAMRSRRRTWKACRKARMPNA